MPHISIPMSSMCEFLDFTPVNPLISKVQIKVCYVGDEPNRNGSIITKAVAAEMAKSLPGSPIVGFFDKEKNDFDEHSREISLTDEGFQVKDITKPYGFVSMDAKVWFQFFEDDGVPHEYLCTEGYIWTEAYPEAKRIIEKGNNQSMELSKNLKGAWTESDKGCAEFFIINEALIEKLCILGEDIEPCFEGASISKQFSLSLGEDFKFQMSEMAKELKQILSEEGKNLMKNNEDFKKKPVGESDEEKKPESEDKKDVPVGESDEEKKPEEDVSKSDDKEKPVGKNSEEKKPENEDNKKGEKSEEKSDKEDEKKKKKYSLEEIPEYVELVKSFASLQKEFDALQEEASSLRSFKASAERAAKEDMIKSFYMLSDADKEDCLTNIDSYSLDDIEAKLSIICVRNKVNLNLDEDKEHFKDPMVYSLGDNDDGDSAPAWIRAVRNTAKEMN